MGSVHRFLGHRATRPALCPEYVGDSDRGLGWGLRSGSGREDICRKSLGSLEREGWTGELVQHCWQSSPQTDDVLAVRATLEGCQAVGNWRRAREIRVPHSLGHLSPYRPSLWTLVSFPLFLVEGGGSGSIAMTTKVSVGCSA